MSLMRTIGRWAVRAFGAAALAATTGCANFYVDGHTRDVPVAEYKKADPVHPVQFLFDFQTKGVDNARATELLKARVAAQVKESGLFDQVSETPVAGGALLTITVNNVPLTDHAFSKGFATGLTFGLAGSTVSDGYVCTASYTPPGASQPISKMARHAIHTTMGNSSAPGDAVKVASIDDGVTKMLHQVVSNVLNDMSHDPAFK